MSHAEKKSHPGGRKSKECGFLTKSQPFGQISIISYFANCGSSDPSIASTRGVPQHLRQSTKSIRVLMHDVKFSIPERELGKSDIEFRVKKNGKVFGTLKVSKGSVVWFPKDTSYGHKIGWTKFDEFMKDGKRYEKR